MRSVTKFIVRPLVIGPLIVLLVASAMAAFAIRGRSPVAEPSPSASGPLDRSTIEPEIIRPLYQPPSPDPAPTPAPARSPSATPEPSPKPRPTIRPPRRANITAFRGLGAWVDLYDYADVDPETAVADMDARGVRTLYLQTARWNKPAPDDPDTFQDPVLAGRWMNAAHAAGMKVVGWYLPAYDDMTRDVRRTKAIATFRSSTGRGFDALGVDVEYKGQAPSLSAWNAGVASHIRKVRIAVGARYPVAAIVPAPLAMEIRPASWAGFPWKALADSSDVFMPMAYWSYRHDCPERPEHCAYGYTKGNVERIRALTGLPSVPVHVIGGVADTITTDDVAKFVSAANTVSAYGASLYDYRTTKPEYWAELAKLRD